MEVNEEAFDLMPDGEQAQRLRRAMLVFFLFVFLIIVFLQFRNSPPGNFGVVPIFFEIVFFLLVIWQAFIFKETNKVTLSDRGLGGRGGVVRSVPIANMRVTEAQIVDLKKNKNLAPKLAVYGGRFNFTSGTRSGWWQLVNGEKAFVYLKNNPEAVYIPTTDGYSLLLSIQDGEGFLKKLQSL